MDTARDEHPTYPAAKAATYLFEGYALDPARGVLHRPDGVVFNLRPKAAEVLKYLAQHAGQVVSRDDLMEAVWPGVIVTDDSITQCVAELRRALSQDGAQLLRTLPKRGYTLDAEVTEATVPSSPPMASAADAKIVAPAPASDTDRIPPPAAPSHRGAWIAATLMTFALVMGIAGWSRLHRATMPGVPVPPAAEVLAPHTRSLVVLPFAIHDGDPELAHLASALAEDLTSDLGRRPENRVVGWGMASTYHGRAIGAGQLGRELGVRYVVEGSLRRIGSTLRVNARLLDAESGSQLWGEILDQPFADIATHSRRMTLRIEMALHHRLLTVEKERGGVALPENASVQDLIERAGAHLALAAPRAGMEQARDLLERALVLEEGSADAHALMAHVIMTFVNHNWVEDRQKSMDLAEQHVARALAINAKHTRGHYVRGMIHQVQRRFGEAIAEFELVIDAVPGWAVAYMRHGTVRILTGQPEEGMADILEAMRISPRDPYIDGWYGMLGLACLMLGRDAEALGYHLRGRAGAVGVGIQPDLASVYAMLGRTEEARTALADYLLARPQATLKGLRAFWFRISEHPLYQATRQRQLDALRQIGMREE